MADTDTQDAAGPGEQESKAADASPGATLRAAREANGQTAADVARALCLELRLVEAIEEDRYEALGAAVFARGHVRRYAQILELDADAIAQRWDERYSTAPPPTVPDPKVAPVAERSSGSPLLLIFIVVALLGAGAAFVWWWLHPPGETSVPVAAAPEPPEAIADEDRALTSPQRDEGPYAPRDTSNDAVAADTQGALGAVTDEAQGVVGEAAEAVSTFTQTAPATLPALGAQAGEGESPAADAPVIEAANDPGPVSVDQALAEAGPAPVATGDEVAVRFIFDESCWVSVRDAAGNTLMLGLREPGTVNDRTGVPPINVTLGRYPGVRIEVDGQPFEVPASAIDGAIARFEIPAP